MKAPPTVNAAPTMIPKMNRIYKLFYGDTPPARTTVQQHAAVAHKREGRDEWPALEQISIVAVVGPRKYELEANSSKFWDLIAPETKLETVAKGFGFTEGPVWDRMGNVKTERSEVVEPEEVRDCYNNIPWSCSFSDQARHLQA